MNKPGRNVLTAIVEIKASLEKVWNCWNDPDDIKQWNNCDADWENLHVENDVREGGRFLFAMAKKDGGEHFNFEGYYDKVIPQQLLTYTLTDGRKSEVHFSGYNPVTITEHFEPVAELPSAMQLKFCEAVHQSFKRYIENTDN
ncbi:SRPBCC domain-containing protein [Mucilaginibacter ginkgonis]|uniref:SRPBCC domain-containing protein n=1 Tax=Mucilaginibacter ginkgonis TaxID=2682091 RepID=A0A6I4HYF6_9SPHI|nr:SRPBCC domain-containing protein [Mucilaginibacter ginkgonis]QQL49622.1 SRPBCC domain-containing protein [Mucilaginibacter ginkgonis]